MSDRFLELTIFHTNDMHGRLEAIARLSAFARRLRTEAEAEGRHVLFWDAGDAADRRVPICGLTKGSAFSPILNAMGYSLQTMGNAVTLTYGPQTMRDVAARADFPILAANFRDGAGPLVEGLQESALFSLAEGLTLGVLGLTAPWGGHYEVFGLHMPDFLELARDRVARLKGEGATIVVVLSHLGLQDDRRLAEEVEGIEFIVGAHSHDLLPEGEVRNGVLIAQTGDYAQRLGRIDLTLERATGRVVERSAEVLEVPTDEAPDPAVLAAIAAAEEEIEILKARPIGELAAPLDLDHFTECGIGDFTADILRQRMGAEAAIISSALFHTGLPAGIVTFGELNAACFTTANPCRTEVSGAQIVAALEKGLDPEISRFMHPSHRGTPIGIPQISGLVVTYDPEQETGQRVRHIQVGGRPLDPERTYTLAHTDAETFGLHGYLEPDADQETYQEVPTIVREAMEEHIREHTPVSPPKDGRWINDRSRAQKLVS
jgi:2',3'-cyclic-nucleotide 2'-phosphodiesterase (5'-nucleotidase family)